MGRLVQITAACSAALSLAVHGFFIGWMSPVLPKLEADDSPIPITSGEGSWLAAINSLSVLLVMFFVPYAVDAVGRKKMLAAGALPHVAMWLMVAFAKSFAVLMAARVVGSLGSGILFTVCPMYLAEIGEAKIRGALSALYQVMLNGGVLFAYCTAPYMSVSNSAFLGIVFPVLLFATILWMPESPYFFMLRAREEEATRELLRLRGKKDAAEVIPELEMMRYAVQMNQATRGSVKDLFLDRTNLRTLLIVAGLGFLQTMSGSIALMTYTTEIFESSGTKLDADTSAIMVACVQLVASLGSSALMDRVGRRTLMIGSFLGCAVSQGAEGIYFYLAEEKGVDVSALFWLPLTGLIIFQISYCLGIGSVLYVVIGEIFHVSVKGLGATLVSAIGTVTSFSVKKLFQVVADTIGTTYNFWWFALMSVTGAVYSYLLLPETKGKTFAEINSDMKEQAGELHKKFKTNSAV